MPVRVQWHRRERGGRGLDEPPRSEKEAKPRPSEPPCRNPGTSKMGACEHLECAQLLRVSLAALPPGCGLAARGHPEASSQGVMRAGGGRGPAAGSLRGRLRPRRKQLPTPTPAPVPRSQGQNGGAPPRGRTPRRHQARPAPCAVHPRRSPQRWPELLRSPSPRPVHSPAGVTAGLALLIRPRQTHSHHGICLAILTFKQFLKNTCSRPKLALPQVRAATQATCPQQCRSRTQSRGGASPRRFCEAWSNRARGRRNGPVRGCAAPPADRRGPLSLHPQP